MCVCGFATGHRLKLDLLRRLLRGMERSLDPRVQARRRVHQRYHTCHRRTFRVRERHTSYRERRSSHSYLCLSLSLFLPRKSIGKLIRPNFNFKSIINLSKVFEPNLSRVQTALKGIFYSCVKFRKLFCQNNIT